ncbi:MAG: hypothetical protein MUO31_03085 [Thermodesulfovibrionales bacterium]|nr:hypothetical protein [Thermodesulfovibrionales bacterium]
MFLYLVQHADAKKEEEDPSRSLSEKGIQDIARIAALLLCGNSEKNIVAFRMAGVVCLKRDDAGVWSLQWMLTPEIVLGEKGIGYSCDSL